MSPKIAKMLTVPGLYAVVNTKGMFFVEVLPDGSCQQLRPDTLEQDGELPRLGWNAQSDPDVVGPFARALASTAGHSADPPWQPIETAPKNKTVLVGFLNSHGKWRTLKATYYPPNTLEISEDDPAYYDDDEESMYAAEGWYEETYTHENILPIGEDPIAWMPLPAAPNAALLAAARKP